MISKVMFPRPVIYTFGPDGLESFEWLKDYERKYGKQASYRPEIISCTALEFTGGQLAPSVTNYNYLSIGGPILTQIALYCADGRADKSFETPRDLKLFFEKPSNAFNQADDWWSDIGVHLFIGTPLEEIDPSMPMNMYSEKRSEVAFERNRNPEFWARLRPHEVKQKPIS